MLDLRGKKELENRLKRLRKEIFDLRGGLNRLNDEKESWFKKKEELKIKIAKDIKDIRVLQDQKVCSRKKAEEVKKERDRYNEAVRKLIFQLKEAKRQKSWVGRKFRSKLTPEKIKEQIEKLELSIEIEGYSYDKEQKVTKKIKELKKQYEEALEVTAVSIDLNSVSNKIKEDKKKADELHKKFKLLMKESSEKDKLFLISSKALNKLKEEQEKAFSNFIGYKDKFSGINKQLKQTLFVMGKIQSELEGYKIDIDKQTTENEKEFLLKKEKMVENKLKKGGKLTTEDLMVFQRDGDSK